MLQESESRRQQVESEIEDLGARFQSVNNHKDSLMELLEKIKSEKDLLEMKVSDLEMSVKDKEIQVSELGCVGLG